MKRLISVLMIFALILALASCGDSTGPSDTDQQETTASEKENDKVDTSGHITEEMVRNHKVTPASDFKYETVAGNIRITGYTGDDVIVVIPDTIDDKPVVELQTLLFGNDSAVKGVYVPNTVKILYGMFTNNENVQVVIAEGVEVLDYVSFLYCSALHTLVLTDSLKSLGKSAINSCGSLKEVYISPNVTSISDDIARTIFWGSDNLTILGKSGSYIETFAQEQGIPFKAVD